VTAACTGMTPGVDVTAACAGMTPGGGRNGGVCRNDAGGMSQDMIPWRIRVPVFVMARLCANAEIGVPRGVAFSLWYGTDYYPLLSSIVKLPLEECIFLLITRDLSCPCSRHSCFSPRHSCFSPRHSCFSPRHSCAGRNLNQGMDVLTYILP